MKMSLRVRRKGGAGGTPAPKLLITHASWEKKGRKRLAQDALCFVACLIIHLIPDVPMWLYYCLPASPSTDAFSPIYSHHILPLFLQFSIPFNNKKQKVKEISSSSSKNGKIGCIRSSLLTLCYFGYCHSRWQPFPCKG